MPSLVSHVTTADGTDLLARHWPAVGLSWASLLLVHSRAGGAAIVEGVIAWLRDQVTVRGTLRV